MFPDNFFGAVLYPVKQDEAAVRHYTGDDAMKLASALIHRLPDRESSILWCYYAEDMTMKKLAQIHHVSATRIRQIIHHGIITTRKHLKYVYQTNPIYELLSFDSYTDHLSTRLAVRNTVTYETDIDDIKEIKPLLSRWIVRLRVKDIVTACQLLKLDGESLYRISGVGKVGIERIKEAQTILREKYGL